MKTIGLIGGMSWESSAEYYRVINEEVKRRLGGLHSAKLVLYSVDFAPIQEMQAAAAWSEATEVMADAARRVEAAGADFIVICTNTMHRMADGVEQAVQIPLLHIADATAAAVREAGLSSIGLLGTRYTMEEDFYKGRLEARHGLQVVIPEPDDRELVNRVIYEELCLGRILEISRNSYLRVIADLVAGGAQGIILGCTEIGLLVGEAEATAAPLFDTARIHALKAVELACT